jgi:hypothetical protein
MLVLIDDDKRPADEIAWELRSQDVAVYEVRPEV